jgi:4-hydroxybenzoate polyprenyltransferase
MATAQTSEVVRLTAARRSLARAAFVALRPGQWSKNLLVFAGIIFGAKLGDAVRWLETLAVFAAYCAASSAAYLANNVRDADEDRTHPVKRDRPVARGELPERTALALAGGLTVAALAISAVLGVGSALFLVGFLVIQAAYTLRLKHVVLIDVMAIGALFVIRAAAGAEAVDVRISPWLLICTALLALFLALAKRRGELVLVGAEAAPGRPVLEGYSLELVDQLVSVVAASTLIAYALYTLESPGGDAMMATIPFVLFGVFRYLLLVHRHDLGEEPERVLLTDRPIILTVAGWAVVSAVILAVG